jgi:hypothetical protein
MAGIPSIGFTDFLDEADTGDLVLFTGLSPVSLAVELGTLTPFSHVAMVIRDTNGDKYLFQSVIEALGNDPLSPRDPSHTGVQAYDLKQAVLDLYDGGDFPSWRRLTTWPQRNDRTIWDAATAIDGIPFPVVKDASGSMESLPTLAWVLALWFAGRYEDTSIPSPLFCSGAVASVLQAASILERTYPPNGYMPADFSSITASCATWAPGIAWADDLLITDLPSSAR